MGVEDIDEQVEWEARRVAAAFGIEEWDECEYRFDGLYLQCTAEREGVRIRCGVATRTGKMTTLDIEESGSSQNACKIRRHKEENKVFWSCSAQPKFHNGNLLACGLYRLGIEDADVCAMLNHPLSTHEKMELRLSMPREFWPQKWRDAENAEVGSLERPLRRNDFANM